MEKLITVRNRCAKELIRSPFVPLLQAAVEAYSRVLDSEITHIRLMGSVPRGQAVVGKSDIDFVAIVRNPPSATCEALLISESSRLSGIHSVVRKVELETETMGRIDPGREFIFRTDSISIWGTDQYPEREVRILNSLLAVQNTPDIHYMAQAYSRSIQDTSQPDEIRFFSSVTGKDFLKSFRRYIILEYALYEPSVAGIHALLVAHYPSSKLLFDSLYRLYEKPVTDKQTILQLQSAACDRWDRMDESLKQK